MSVLVWAAPSQWGVGAGRLGDCGGECRSWHLGPLELRSWPTWARPLDERARARRARRLRLVCGLAAVAVLLASFGRPV